MSVGVKAALELKCIRNDRQGHHQATSTLEAEPEGEPKGPQQGALQFLSKGPINQAVIRLGARTWFCPFLYYPFSLVFRTGHNVSLWIASKVFYEFSFCSVSLHWYPLSLSHIGDVSIIVFFSLKILCSKILICCHIFESHHEPFK